MKTFLKTLLLLIILFSASPSFASKVKVAKAENNMIAWYIEDHTLPIVTIKIAFRDCGYAYDPDSVSGLSFMASLLLDEGAGEMDAEEFQKELSKSAIVMSFSSDKDNFYVSAKTLSKNLQKTLDLLTIAITSPTFDVEPLRNAQNKALISLEKKEEDADYIAQREWEKAVYKNHPYSNPLFGRKESIPNITRADLLNYIKKNFVRSSAVISVVGDITKGQVLDMLDKSFSKIPDAPQSNKSIENFTTFPDSKTIYVHRNLPQSSIVFGQKAVGIKDKNFYPLHLVNYVLGGGGFESRLVSEIREKRGLTYSLYSFINRNDKSSTLEGYYSTKNSSVKESLDIFWKEINLLKSGGITKDELELAKNYSIGSFPLNMDSYEKLVNYLNFMQIEELGTDFLETRNEKVKAVNLDEANTAIVELIDPKKLTIVVVGPNKEKKKDE